MRLPAALLPLRHPAFRLLWLANLCANTGMWMQNTGAGWLMTSLTPSASMVSMIQVAILLPTFLLALPAGAIADLVDRRRYLLATQAWMAACGMLLTVLAASGGLGAWGLVGITFAIGIGMAMTSPAWGATTPEVVPRADLPQAIVLNGMGFNLTRAVGPAIAGFVVAAAGPEATFAINAFCLLLVIGALARWKREEAPRVGPREHLFSAMRAGVGFVRASPVMRATTIRGIVFFMFGAAVWGLLPLLVRVQLGLGPEWFGILLGAMGTGAVSGGFLLPLLRARHGRGQIVTGAALLANAMLILLGQSSHWAMAFIAMFTFGMAWIAGASTLQASAQLSVPAWVRARALGIYQVATFGGLTLGAIFGGWAAEALGLGFALGAAGLVGGIAALATHRMKLEPPPVAPPSTAPLPVPEPVDAALLREVAAAGQEVLEVVRYTIAPANRAAFLAAMAECRQVRRRVGALDWRLAEDMAHPERWVEIWSVASWTDHLREAGRLTEADQAALAAAAALHRGPGPPEAVRYASIAPR